MSDSYTPYAVRRALATSLGFGAWGLLMAWFILDWWRSWPLFLFYFVLLLNSFFSVRTFASITPRSDLLQQFFDILLGLCLALLPVNYNFVQNFVLVATALFIVATLKYVFLAPLSGFSRLLYQKIRIDALGIMLCFLALTGVLLGYGRWSAILWSFVFLLANVYVLGWRPHYSLELHEQHVQ